MIGLKIRLGGDVRLTVAKRTLPRRIKNSVRPAMIKFGGYTRRTARQSIKHRKKKTPSPAGTPPRSHHENRIMKWVQWSYNDHDMSLVVGSELHRSSARISSQTVPQLHEHGGTALIKVKGKHLKKKKKLKKGSKQARAFRRKIKKDPAFKTKFVGHRTKRKDFRTSVTFRPRPFIYPAAMKNIRILGYLLGSSINRG